MSKNTLNFKTRAVHGAEKTRNSFGSIIPPIYQTATYVLEEVGKHEGFDYTRSSNPSRKAFEDQLAALEGALDCFAFSSGMAAVDSCFRILKAGDHIVCSDDVYGGVSRLLDQLLCNSGIEVSYVDTSDTALIQQAIRPDTKLIWVETPTNPLLKVSSIGEIAKLAKSKDILLGVDSTFATPVLLRPLELGADIVLHSTSKYISGHNQLIGGAVLTNNTEIARRLAFIQKSVGAIPGPFDCWLNQVGLRTLALRVEKQCENATEAAKFLNEHPKVQRVHFPGLSSHPQHAIAKEEMSGFGAMISFELKGGLSAGKQLMNSLNLCSLAESLGAVETMITHPASMTHCDVPPEIRRARGLSDGLIRLSLGIEAIEDILADLSQGLATLSPQRTLKAA